MIPISSVFSHLPCADGFECRRPYCRYNHTAINTPRSPERSATDLVKEGLIPQKKTTEIPSGPVVIQQETYDEYSYQGYYAQDEDEDEPFAPAEPMYNPYDPLGKKAESQKKTKEPVKAKAVEFSMMDKPALPVDLGEDDILLNLNPEAKKEKEVVKTKVPKKPEPPRPIKLSELHTKRRNSKELMKEEQEDEVSIKKRKLTQEHLEELEKKAKLFDMYMKNLHKAADIDAQIKEIEGRRNQMKHDPSFVDSLFEAEPSKPMVEEKPTTSSAITTPILTANSMGKRIVNGKITAKNQMLNRLESAQKANLAKKNEPINISLKLAAEKRAVGGTKTAPSMINKVAKQWATGNGSNRTASSTVSKGETRTAHSGNPPFFEGNSAPFKKELFTWRGRYFATFFDTSWMQNVNKTLESRYACCDGELTVKGCAIQSVHVHETMRKSVLQQFCRTPPPIDKNDRRSNKVYAMDCEMVFTTWGMSVARVSVVDVNDEEVLDIIIKPKDKVLDCNTKFSGLTEEMLEKAEYDLDKARKKLFELINSETILIGHSLESDLRALRLVHRKVVDTAIVFPHRLGPPFKRALRTLASEYLQKIIQEDTSGHCSKEDSSACIQLMLHKVRSEPGSNL
uniref:Exonuclease domain-containing protein n=1 Tax=Bursaphelenchus xylophilus TaxID=6326 RepID=A0A1I7SFF3_BURXY